jgi:hypothetical protein
VKIDYDYGTEEGAWALNGLEEPMRRHIDISKPHHKHTCFAGLYLQISAT